MNLVILHGIYNLLLIHCIDSFPALHGICSKKVLVVFYIVRVVTVLVVWHGSTDMSHVTTIIVKESQLRLLSLFIYFFSFLWFQIDRMGQKDSALEDEVRYRYNSVILNYKKSQDNTQR